MGRRRRDGWCACWGMRTPGCALALQQVRLCCWRGGAETPQIRAELARLALSDPDPLVREAAALSLNGGSFVETLPTLSLMERILSLRRVPLFADLPPAELKQVAGIAEELLSRPTASCLEQAPAAWIESFARRRRLRYREDRYGNLVVTWPGRGKPSAPPVVLMAHLDLPGFFVHSVDKGR